MEADESINPTHGVRTVLDAQEGLMLRYTLAVARLLLVSTSTTHRDATPINKHCMYLLVTEFSMVCVCHLNSIYPCTADGSRRLHHRLDGAPGARLDR
jgi:hypothetical protein